MNWVIAFTLGLGTIFALSALIVFIMVFWPRRASYNSVPITAKAYREHELSNGVIFETSYLADERRFLLSDGGWIVGRSVGPDSAKDVVILIHGIAAAGERWVNPAGLLSQATGAQVIAIDLRGHGQSSGARFDVDYVGQYEDDISQVISQLKETRPSSRFWLAGHSMGGGVLLRHALKTNRPMVEGYVLLAPSFGPGPTAPNATTPDSPLWMNQIRLVGLILLNLVRIRRFNHLPVAHVDAPPDFPAYSFAAITSSLPLPPVKPVDALRAMERGFLIVAGANDKAVRPEGYQEVAGKMEHGSVVLLPELGHDSIVNAPETHAVIANWMEAQRQI